MTFHVMFFFFSNKCFFFLLVVYVRIYLASNVVKLMFIAFFQYRVVMYFRSL